DQSRECLHIADFLGFRPLRLVRTPNGSTVAVWVNERFTYEAQNTLLLVLASVAIDTVVAQEAKVTPLFSKELQESPGKEGMMIVVEYPPGNTDPIHRHNAHGFIYVLEGSVVMQVKGGKQVTLTSGQTFYEGPDDVHVVGRNASS